MAYSELIKNFSKIREYMRQFYVYGFRSRNEFELKSARSYDNERRRVESWLSEYMRFRQEEDGKIVFMSIDSRRMCHNPLYTAFKTKSFTDNDITFHFYLLDLLKDGGEYTVYEMLELFDSEYFFNFDNAGSFDESNLRKKLKEYVRYGILKERKQGREVYLSLKESSLDTERLKDAVYFFSEENPLGVAGSYISDRFDSDDSVFRFKHNYIFAALDSQIIYELVQAMNEDRDAEINIRLRDKTLKSSKVFPVKIYISTQNGRQYLLCYLQDTEHFIFVRVDNIENVKVSEKNPSALKYKEKYESFKKHLWGVAVSENLTTDRVEMTIRLEDDEEYIYSRLLREKRCGEVIRKDKNTCVFTADVYDARELVPWIRTFFGRIESFYCSSDFVTNQLNADLNALAESYGGD